jgi:hypothetical protein
MNDRAKLKHLLSGEWIYHEEEAEYEAGMRLVDEKRKKICYYTRLDSTIMKRCNFVDKVWYPTPILPPDDCQLVTWGAMIPVD